MRRALMVGPAAAIIALLAGGGLLLALAGTGWQDYARVLANPEFRGSLLLTLWVAVASTLFSAAAAIVLAAGLWNAPGWVRVAMQMPLALPHLAIAISFIHLIAPSGLIARLAFGLGWIASPVEFPVLLADSWGAGIIFVYVLREAPFLAAIAVAVLIRSGGDLHEVARTLGASRLRRLTHVTLPLILPALMAGSMAVFAFVFSAFEVPFLLGRPYPAMLGVVAQRKFLEPDLAARPEALAFAMVTAAVSAAAVWAGVRLARRSISI